MGSSVLNQASSHLFWQSIAKHLSIDSEYNFVNDYVVLKWNSIVLYRLICGVIDNGEKFNPLKDKLSTLGLPFRAWVLEYDGHLFKCYRDDKKKIQTPETFEASFTQEFLCEVVDCMWQLSAGTFSRTPYSYDTLAARLRTRNVAKVRLAVRRISIVTRYTTKDDNGTETHHDIIHFSDSQWWWNSGKKPEDENTAPGHGLHDIHHRISCLEKPVE